MWTVTLPFASAQVPVVTSASESPALRSTVDDPPVILEPVKLPPVTVVAVRRLLLFTLALAAVYVTTIVEPEGALGVRNRMGVVADE